MKKLFNSKVLILSLVMILSIGVFMGCQKEDVNENNDNGEATLKGNVAVVGSTSVTPVAQELADAFMAKNKDVTVDVQGVGSSAGIKATSDGTADVGMASRNLKPEEGTWGLTEHVIAYDGIAVVVHPNNSVSDLTKEQITSIFKGEITNWSEVGGDNAEIILVSREAGSGTRGAFEELMDLESDGASLVREDAVFLNGNGAVKGKVAKDENSIGYVSLSYMDDTLKGVKVEGVDPTVENILAGSYKVSRPFLMLTKGDVNDAANAYLEFIMSDEGQEIVAEKLIPVNKK